MRVFVTGASGFIGSAVVPELLAAGHEVVGLARSDAAAEAVAAAGAEVLRGSLDDLDGPRAGGAASDGVVHLAFIHDFSRYASASRTDLRAIEAMGAALEGSDRPLIIASGFVGLPAGRTGTERDMSADSSPRVVSARAALALAERGVRSSVVRLAPSVHGEGDGGFLATLIGVARAKGVAGYIGDGANRWPGVHRGDAARLFRLAVEKAPAGSVLHGTAEVIGRHLGLPVAPAEVLGRVRRVDGAAPTA